MIKAHIRDLRETISTLFTEFKKLTAVSSSLSCRWTMPNDGIERIIRRKAILGQKRGQFSEKMSFQNSVKCWNRLSKITDEIIFLYPRTPPAFIGGFQDFNRIGGLRIERGCYFGWRAPLERRWCIQAKNWKWSVPFESKLFSKSWNSSNLRSLLIRAKSKYKPFAKVYWQE